VPDFLCLLLQQNERLPGRQARFITDLLVSALHREISAQKFEADMLWSRLDPRIRERWVRFQDDLHKRAKWDRPALVSELATLTEDDLERIRSQRSLRPREALLYALDKARSVLKHPVGEKQPRFSLLAYSGMLFDLGASGSIGVLLEEHAFFKSLGSEGGMGDHQAALAKLVEEKVPSHGLAAGLASWLDAVGPETEQFRQAVEFAVWLGAKIVPLLVDQLRQSPNKAARRGLCSLLAALSRKFGERPLLSALADSDHEQVIQALRILSDLGLPDTVQHISALLYHPEPRVREAAVQALGRIGGPVVVNALIRFVKARVPSAEALRALAAVSSLREEGVAGKLLEAYPRVGYEVQVGIVSALGRFQDDGTRAFLEPIAKGTLMERLKGRNKELRLAARAALKRSLGR